MLRRQVPERRDGVLGLTEVTMFPSIPTSFVHPIPEYQLAP